MAFKIRKTSDVTVWAEFGEGFIVEVRHVTQAERRAMRTQSQSRHWDKKTHRQVEEADDEKFYTLFSDRAIVKWKGLTGDLLRRWVDAEEYPDGEVPYSREAAVELMMGFGRFDEFITLISADLEMAEAVRRESLTKNSQPTPGVPSSSVAEATGPVHLVVKSA